MCHGFIGTAGASTGRGPVAAWRIRAEAATEAGAILNSCGYGLYSYGLYNHGLYSYGPM